MDILRQEQGDERVGARMSGGGGDLVNAARTATVWPRPPRLSEIGLNHHEVDIRGPRAVSGMSEASHADIVDFSRLEPGQFDASLDLAELPFQFPCRLVVGIAQASLHDIGEGSVDLAEADAGFRNDRRVSTPPFWVQRFELAYCSSAGVSFWIRPRGS